MKEFLIEYEKLCQKYQMGIGSCGCCSSPFLEKEGEKTIKERICPYCKGRFLIFTWF